jgi:hypothetical protein
MWNVVTEYGQGKEVKDDKNRKRDVAWRNDLTGLPFQLYIYI